MKNLIKKLKEKLELDNPERYVDGYYQLTKKQKVWWSLGIFILCVLFSVLAEPFLNENKSENSGLAFVIAYTLLVLVFSLTMALPFFGYCFFVKKRSVIVYQVWTIATILTMIGLVFKIDLSKMNIFF